MAENVITLARHSKAQARTGSALGNLMQSFARHRRDMDDVFWLKENAEILNILECTGAPVTPADVQSYMPFYTSLEARIGFFPQYYRFLTSIALDLEALGLGGDMGERLCDITRKSGLPEAELSDLQRAEAVRLLARRGFAVQGTDELVERLHGFIDRPETFALPNRKAAYELTHIVFYLSEYGRRDPRLSQNARRSLIYTGLLAHLEQNVDLLSEVCVALHYAGDVPPAVWTGYIKSTMQGFDRRAYQSSGPDDYHEYLVGNWACAVSGIGSFDGSYGAQGVSLYARTEQLGALRAVSEHLLARDDRRTGDWAVTADGVLGALSPAQGAHVQAVVAATEEFGAFFEIFARPASAAGSTVPAHIQGRGQ